MHTHKHGQTKNQMPPARSVGRIKMKESHVIHLQCQLEQSCSGRLEPVVSAEIVVLQKVQPLALNSNKKNHNIYKIFIAYFGEYMHQVNIL